jgi:hypothetical protein
MSNRKGRFVAVLTTIRHWSLFSATCIRSNVVSTFPFTCCILRIMSIRVCVCMCVSVDRPFIARKGGFAWSHIKAVYRCPRPVDTPPVTSTKKLRPFLVCNSDNVFCAVGIKFIKIIMISLRKPKFETRPCQMGFVVYRVVVGQVPLPVLRFSPFSIIPAMLCTHLHLNTLLMRRTSGRRMETLKQRNALSDAIGKVSTGVLISP